MRYHFRAGRGKNIIVDGATTFAELGFAILKEYHINAGRCIGKILRGRWFK